ncbi:hypothetical protein WDW37_12225 [Bdellovibrionota bacterium FG-1]
MIVPGVVICAALLSGCSHSGPDSSTPARELKEGATLYSFEPEKVIDLLITKADPSTGDQWTARVHRPDSKSSEWEILTEGAGGPLLDRKADGLLIAHLLDSLHTTPIVHAFAGGPPESLGLAHPRFALKWRIEPTTEFELKIGNPADPDTAFAMIPGQSPFVVGGATLKILDYLTHLESLRLKTWAGFNSDDMDEIEIFHGKKTEFYAQREGTDWTNRNHKKTRADLSPWLEKLTHARVLEFIDDPLLAKNIRTAIQAHPDRQALFKDRHGLATRLLIGKGVRERAHHFYALSSKRPEGVFQIYPTSAKSLDPP